MVEGVVVVLLLLLLLLPVEPRAQQPSALASARTVAEQLPKQLGHDGRVHGVAGGEE